MINDALTCFILSIQRNFAILGFSLWAHLLCKLRGGANISWIGFLTILHPHADILQTSFPLITRQQHNYDVINVDNPWQANQNVCQLTYSFLRTDTAMVKDDLLAKSSFIWYLHCVWCIEQQSYVLWVRLAVGAKLNHYCLFHSSIVSGQANPSSVTFLNFSMPSTFNKAQAAVA